MDEIIMGEILDEMLDAMLDEMLQSVQERRRANFQRRTRALLLLNALGHGACRNQCTRRTSFRTVT